MRQEFRKSQELYFLAYHWMINFEEAVDELIIGRYNRNPLRIDRVNGKNELCVTLGVDIYWYIFDEPIMIHENLILAGIR